MCVENRFVYTAPTWSEGVGHWPRHWQSECKTEVFECLEATPLCFVLASARNTKCFCKIKIYFSFYLTFLRAHYLFWFEVIAPGSVLKLFLFITFCQPYLQLRVSSFDVLASLSASVSNLFHTQPNPPTHSSYKIPSILAFMCQLPSSRTLAPSHFIALYQSWRKCVWIEEEGEKRRGANLERSGRVLK